jgi:hypothetical protein
VANHPKISRDWHPDNPPAREVPRGTQKKFLWLCPVEGHSAYIASCNKRCIQNTGCPVCSKSSKRHPVISVGRPDLALEWDTERNTKSPSEVTLGSRYVAGWVCSSNPEHAPWQAPVSDRALKGCGCPRCKKEDGSRFRPSRQFGSISS